MNQPTPGSHNASAAPCLGLPCSVRSAPGRARLPQPPRPWTPTAPGGQSRALGGAGVRRGALGPRRRPHRWAPYRVSVPGAGPDLPGDGCPGDAAGGSRSYASLPAAAPSPRGPEGRPAARSRQAGQQRRGAARGGARTAGRRGRGQGRGAGRGGGARAGPGPAAPRAPSANSRGPSQAECLRARDRGERGRRRCNSSPTPAAPVRPAGGACACSRERPGHRGTPGGVRTLALAPLPAGNWRTESAICKGSGGWWSAKPIYPPGSPGSHQNRRGTGPPSLIWSPGHPRHWPSRGLGSHPVCELFPSRWACLSIGVPLTGRIH